MRGKAIWKMYNHGGNEAEPPGLAVRLEHVIACFVQAIQKLPGRKSDKHDPIFEPHYKLVSVVHKLVQKGDLDVCALSPLLKANRPVADTCGRCLRLAPYWKPLLL